MKLFKLANTFIVTLTLVACLGAQNPETKPDESWITLSGTVVSTQNDSFRLDYGEGTITVEMDDWEWDEVEAILAGDEVTVRGRVDSEIYEMDRIEAGSVYVEDLNTYFYANPADEENLETPVIVEGEMSITGTVIAKSGREFTLDTAGTDLKVDTIQMTYNPLDDEGYQQITIGDRVKVFGEMDSDFWEKKEFMADSVVTLSSSGEVS